MKFRASKVAIDIFSGDQRLDFIQATLRLSDQCFCLVALELPEVRHQQSEMASAGAETHVLSLNHSNIEARFTQCVGAGQSNNTAAYNHNVCMSVTIEGRSSWRVVLGCEYVGLEWEGLHASS